MILGEQVNLRTVVGSSLESSISYAWNKGAIPVVAAGNDYVLTADLDRAPAVVVSATDRDDAAPDYSNGVGDAGWAVAAPGGDGSDTPASCSQQGEPRGILSTFWSPTDPRRAYACLSGTSMAAPHVSGALAVLRSAGLSPEVAVQRLLDTAVDLGEPSTDPIFGSGRIDLAAAVAAAAVPATTPTSEPTTTEPAEGDGDGLQGAAPPVLVDLDGSGDDVPLPLAGLAGALVVLTGLGAVALALRER